MLTKAYVTAVPEYGKNNYKVRVPLFEDNTGTPVYFNALLCTLPGLSFGYSVGDCVYVSFEGDTLNEPVIIGKLFVKADDTSVLYTITNSLTVTDRVSLPADTKIGGYSLKDIFLLYLKEGGSGGSNTDANPTVQYFYLASDSDSYPDPDDITSVTIPTLSAELPYLWLKLIVTYSGTSDIRVIVSLIAEYSGSEGLDLVSVTKLYYCSDSVASPELPTEHVTESSNVGYNKWNLTCPVYTPVYKYYFTCSELYYSDGSYDWSPATNINQDQASQALAKATEALGKTVELDTKITTEAGKIRTEVAEHYLSNDSSSEAAKEALISVIEQTPGSVSISAKNVNISGEVTLQSYTEGLGDGTTKINGGSITTNTLNADAIKAGTLYAKQVILYSDSSETVEEAINSTVKTCNVYYCLTESYIEQPSWSSEWLDTAPEPKSGYYIWSITQFVAFDGTVTFSKPVCMSGPSNITITIESSNGNVFRSDVSSILICHVFEGNKEITYDTDKLSITYIWSKLDKDGNPDPSWSPEYTSEGLPNKIVITTADVQQRAQFICSVTIDNLEEV